MARVGLGEHRVVEVARILAVDGDQGHLAQVEAMAHRRRLGAFGLVERGLGELDRDVVGGDGDQAHGARVAHRSDALEHLGPARQRAACRLDPDDVARHRAVFVGRPDLEALPELAVGRTHQAHAVAAVGLLVEAEDLLGAAAQPPDDARFVGVAAAFEIGQHAVADGGGGAAARRLRSDLDAGRQAVLLLVVPARHGDQVAVAIDPYDLQHGHVGERGGIAEGLGAIGGDLARVAQVAQQLLEFDALVALEAPGAGDLALADRRGAVADESQQFVAGRDFALSHWFQCGEAARSWPWRPCAWARVSSCQF
jgi:hypothetical protein